MLCASFIICGSVSILHNIEVLNTSDLLIYCEDTKIIDACTLFVHKYGFDVTPLFPQKSL